jgi:hypothetical protein
VPDPKIAPRPEPKILWKYIASAKSAINKIVMITAERSGENT